VADQAYPVEVQSDFLEKITKAKPVQALAEIIWKTRGIVDLMLSKAIRQHRANTLTHLVVEMKAPSVKINDDEVTQVEKYAFSVMKDERFRNVDTTWVFWAISDDLGDYAIQRMTDTSTSAARSTSC
jgi:hypothetical protein